MFKKIKSLISTIFTLVVLVFIIVILANVPWSELKENTAKKVEESIEFDKEKVPFPNTIYEEPNDSCFDFLPDFNSNRERHKFENWFNFYCG